MYHYVFIYIIITAAWDEGAMNVVPCTHRQASGLDAHSGHRLPPPPALHLVHAMFAEPCKECAEVRKWQPNEGGEGGEERAFIYFLMPEWPLRIHSSGERARSFKRIKRRAR